MSLTYSLTSCGLSLSFSSMSSTLSSALENASGLSSLMSIDSWCPKWMSVLETFFPVSIEGSCYNKSQYKYSNHLIPTKAFCKKSTLFGLLQLTVFVCDSTRSFKDEVPFDFPNFCLVTTCCCCKISFLIALVFLLGSMVMADTLCPMLSIVPRADLVPICDVGRCNSVLASNAPSGFSLLMRICVLPSCGRAYTKYRV